jgi:hypothetical protein
MADVAEFCPPARRWRTRVDSGKTLWPLDDEPETDEERNAVAEAKRERTAGVPGIPLEQVKGELGLA